MMDAPAHIEAALSTETDCLAHAERAIATLGRGEIIVGIFPRGGFKSHAVAVVDGYVIDNGTLAGPAWRIFPARDLYRHMEGFSCEPNCPF